MGNESTKPKQMFLSDRTSDTYLPPEDGEALTTGPAHQPAAARPGGRVGGVARPGGEPEESRSGPEGWLLPPDGPCAHDFTHQSAAGGPHGRGPCLTAKLLSLILTTDQ